MAVEFLYLIASEELKAEIDDLTRTRHAMMLAADDYAKKHGGKCAAHKGGELIGIVFDSHPGYGWRKNPQYTSDGSKVYLPLRSTAKGKEIAGDLEFMKLPSMEDYAKLAGLHRIMVIGDRPEHGRGFPVHRTSLEILDGKAVYTVPTSSVDKRPKIGDNLAEICYPDCLELKAAHERSKAA